MKNYAEALDHMHCVGQLNDKGKDELIECLKAEVIDLKQKIIDLEHKLQYYDMRKE